MAIPDEELDFTFFRSSGPGGQKKNTTDSSVRLRHLPTGIVVIATQSRSQHRNKLLALEELERRLAIRNKRKKPRRATAPTLTARRKRVEEKRQRGGIKQLRKGPGDED